jgi:methyl-accepting chemotaxis protein WspA
MMRFKLETKIIALALFSALFPIAFLSLVILIDQSDLGEGAMRILVWALGIGLAVAILAGLLAASLGSRLTRPFTRLIRVARQVARGDIQRASQSINELLESEEIPDSAEQAENAGEQQSQRLSEAQQLMLAIKTMTENLNSLVGQVQRSGIQVTSSSTQIAASARELDSTVSEQATATNEVLATTTEISGVSRELEQIVSKVADVTSQTAVMAGEGRKDLEAMEQAMRRLASSTSTVAAKLNVISEKTENVQGVVTTISKVADQTNLLSLNAAIEAEKAGEYGKGFSVVAREIRRLADQTAIATLEIEQMFKEMQSAVSSGVIEMDRFSQEVNTIVGEVKNISAQQETIIQQVQALKPRLEEVNEGMASQSEGAEQIQDAMVRLNEGAQQSADSLSEFRESSEHLNDAIRGLQSETSNFKVGAAEAS